MTSDELLAGLPGEALVRQGLADVTDERRTVPAYVVAIARPRLDRAGLLTQRASTLLVDFENPERELYRLLRAEGGDAYSRYNALLRELASFESALDSRLRRSSHE